MHTNQDAKEMLEFFYTNHRNLFPNDEAEKSRAEKIVLTKTLDSEYSRYEENKLIKDIRLALEKNLSSSTNKDSS